METVAEENPLRSATSRMVTALEWERRRGASESRRAGVAWAGLESADDMRVKFRALAGGHYRTMRPVSSTRVGTRVAANEGRHRSARAGSAESGTGRGAEVRPGPRW